nr:mucin-2-like [Penaeus vannamei]
MQLPALLCCTLATATATIVLTRAVVPDRVIRLRSLDCASDLGERGVCMFAWHCSTSGGTHLATCIDGFFFGSCCRLPSENAIEEPGTNKTQPSVTSDPLVTPGASAASTTPTTPYPKTKPLLKESHSTLPAASPNIQKVSATTFPTPEASATTLQESAKTTLSIRESTTIRPTQELATTTLATQESIETTTTECATTSPTQGVSLTTLPSQESFTTSLTTQESFTTSLTTQESFTTSLTTQESFTTAAPTELPATDSSYEASTDGGASVDQEPTEENLQVMGEGQQQPTEGTQSETAEKDQQTNRQDRSHRTGSAGDHRQARIHRRGSAGDHRRDSTRNPRTGSAGDSRRNRKRSHRGNSTRTGSC